MLLVMFLIAFFLILAGATRVVDSSYCGKDFVVQLANTANSSAWVALTPYTVGKLVTNGSNVYRCTTAGTSAASGGPTGTATTPVTDGTVSWLFYGTTIGYTTVAGMTANSLTMNNEQVDITDKGSASWKTLFDCGIQSFSISGSGRFTNQVAMRTLQKCVMRQGGASKIQTFKLISGYGDSFVGLFEIASLERSGDVKEEEKFTIALQSSETIVRTDPLEP
jgi:predicted secreted protein